MTIVYFKYLITYCKCVKYRLEISKIYFENINVTNFFLNYCIWKYSLLFCINISIETRNLALSQSKIS